MSIVSIIVAIILLASISTAVYYFFIKVPVPDVDCKVSSWSSCTDGVSNRTVTTPKSGTGKSCPELSQSCSDCVAKAWGPCDPETESQSREILTQKTGNGEDCILTQECKVDCEIKPWSQCNADTNMTSRIITPGSKNGTCISDITSTICKDKLYRLKGYYPGQDNTVCGAGTGTMICNGYDIDNITVTVDDVTGYFTMKGFKGFYGFINGTKKMQNNLMSSEKFRLEYAKSTGNEKYYHIYRENGNILYNENLEIIHKPVTDDVDLTHDDSMFRIYLA